MLTVGALRKSLEGVDDNTLVLTSSNDHSYRRVGSAEFVDVEVSEDNGFFEYFEDDQMMDGSKKEKKFVIV